MSDEIWEQLVRERAHAIWEREGRPDDAAERHWAMAAAELRAEGAERLAVPIATLIGAGSTEPTEDQGSGMKRKATRTRRQPGGKGTS